MFPYPDFWKKFYRILIPFAFLITIRSAFVDFYINGIDESLRLSILYYLVMWVLWLVLAPGILWLFNKILLARTARISLLALLVIGSSAVHQGLHMVILSTTFYWVRIASGSVIVIAFLVSFYAIRLQEERRQTEIQNLKLEKETEEARLLDIRAQLDASQLFQKLRRARESMTTDAEDADQQLTDLADSLRAILQSVVRNLDSFRPVETSTKAHPELQRMRWMLYASCVSVFIGIWITSFSIIDDILSSGLNPSHWNYFWSMFLSWIGVALLTPFIFWMGRRFDPLKNLVFHIAGCILFYCVIGMGVNISIFDNNLSFEERLSSILGFGLIYGFKFDVYGAVLLAAVMLNRLESKRKEELRLAQNEILLLGAHLEALKMQLHPHFLFNALNSIIELIHQDQALAAELLLRLERFLEMTLEAQNVQEVTLRRELEFVQCYLDMQKVRFPRRLHFKMDIDERSMESRVPVLILQPLVENAIRHGIAQNPHPGEISIHSYQGEGMLRLRVRDTGPGMASQIVHEGVGIMNTRHRLRQMYGRQFHFEMKNEQSGGMVVSLEIPCR